MLRNNTLITGALLLTCLRCGDSEVAPIASGSAAAGGSLDASSGTSGTAGAIGAAGVSGSGGEGGFGGDGEGGLGGASGDGGLGGRSGSGGFAGDGAGGFGAFGGTNGFGGFGGAAGNGGGSCPNDLPDSNDPCIGVQPFTQCTYGPTQCACTGGGWNCGTCPGTAPTDNTPCDASGLVCRIGMQLCFCGVRGPGPGVNPSWNCFGAPAPDGGSGPFGGAGGGGPSDASVSCPGSEPPNNAPCNAPPGTECRYGNSVCGCFGGAWRC